MKYRGLELPVFSPEDFIPFLGESTQTRRAVQTFPKDYFVRIAIAISLPGMGLKRTLARAEEEYLRLRERYDITVINFTYGLVKLVKLPLAECQLEALEHHIRQAGQTCTMPPGYQLAAEVPKIELPAGADLDRHDSIDTSTEAKIAEYQNDSWKRRRVRLDDIEDDNQFIKTSFGDVLVDIEPRLRPGRY
jgi:hypothetical protein